MNNLVESTYALRMLWSYVKCTINKYNLKYLVLPIIYLIVILLVIPNGKVLVNQVGYTTHDSYTVAISKEDKIKVILDKYNLTENEFKVLSAIVLSEAEANSYEDAYAVINTIYNRTKSKNWVRSVNNTYGTGKGESLYYQAIAPNQFVVYQHGTYKRNLNNTSSIGNDAIIDFLYEEEILHNYLSFRSNYIKIANSESFSDNGNNYFNILVEENRI